MTDKSGIHRFLSRREKVEKKPQPHQKAERKPDHFGGIFTDPPEPHARVDKERAKKVGAILDRLRNNGIDTMVESNAEYALRASRGDSEAAYKLLLLLQWTYEGIVQAYNPQTKLLGAVNRENVTCYADALLFAMFARLDSFEAMLYDSFDDTPRKTLAGVLRLWVNLLRSGKLITTDVTWALQHALAECGWPDAARLKQQDPSEAFSFITGQLGLPLLTLKMDLYHTGKEDLQDDHKFVNERLLEVAIPEQPEEGSNVITLEQCLEQYFNNRIEVKRYLERQRRDTLKSAEAEGSTVPSEKEPAAHVEVVEMAEASTPTVQTQLTESPIQCKNNPLDKLRPAVGRKRADSIFSQRRNDLIGIDPEALQPTDPNASTDTPPRKMSTRTEVLMPAWQFFKLLPWYTDHLPVSDAQVAAHFSKKRPVLGVCLKRYSYTNQGQARRRDTYVDIPLEIAVPNFVSNDQMSEEGSLVGHFRLQLQSVVCHRGVSVTSGHYVALCRGTAANAVHHESHTSSRRGSQDSSDGEDPWMLFDDLAKERVTYVDIHQALRNETPYLLFYQVMPIDGDGLSIHDLPSYAEAMSRSQSHADLFEKPDLHMASPGSDNTSAESTFNLALEGQISEGTDFAGSAQRISLDVPDASDRRRGRASYTEERRRSIAFENPNAPRSAGSTSDASVRTEALSAPSTPSEEKGNAFLNAISPRRGSRISRTTTGSRSRPTTPGPDSSAIRLNFNMGKLTQRMSRNDVAAMPHPEAVTGELPGPGNVHEKASPRKSHSLSPSKNPSVENIVAVKPKSSNEMLDNMKSPSKPAARKDKAAAKHEKRRSKGRSEDRDCVVM
ncbi:hypothetical protein LTR62_006993 [Meristemomyces frigidus]|uniref:ubiquitinyl hydrolase 1 n=1 Tax=Meristemomyces frigidus TaxID=1508187 RepID=A0AAN7TCQ7_9PEZI|nr:hypothetical protein LTR62_006993 [Meristemomyces frigidus]